MKKDYIKDIPNGERRYFNAALSLKAVEENAADKDSRLIEGYAAVFNSNSEDFGGWIERIDSAAFDDVLNDDAVALFNHSDNLILARNKETLSLSIDKKGLKYSFSAPNTTAGNDLLENIKLRNVKASSFAFTVKEEKWTEPEDKNEPAVRTIMKVERLYDVSPVVNPAYPDTSVAKRSLQHRLEEEEKEAKAYLVNVMKRKHEIFKLTSNI